MFSVAINFAKRNLVINGQLESLAKKNTPITFAAVVKELYE